MSLSPKPVEKLPSDARQQSTAAVLATYADILLLLIAHSPSIPSPNLLMISGTSKKKKYFNIKAIHGSSPFPCPYRLRHNVILFTTTFRRCQLWGFLLEVCWSFVFWREDELNEAKVKSVEQLTDLHRLIMCALFSPPRSGNLRPGTHPETGD